MSTDLRSVLTTIMPRLQRFGMALTGSKDETDELVQNVCERVLTRGDQFREQARLDVWIYGIMRHLWIDRVRFRRRRHHEELSAADKIANDDGRQTTEARMTLSAVREALGALSEEHRSVLVLVCVDGLKYREAAEVLKVPVGTVMSRLARARQELALRIYGQETPVYEQQRPGSVTELPAWPRRAQVVTSRP